jgi:hypothetical protein
MLDGNGVAFAVEPGYRDMAAGGLQARYLSPVNAEIKALSTEAPGTRYPYDRG